MTRLRARSEGAGRIAEATPTSHWKILTILGAMSVRGMVAAMTIERPPMATSSWLSSSRCSARRSGPATWW
jgi:hypothetical protein